MAAFIAGFLASVVGDIMGLSEWHCLLLALVAGMLVTLF